ncbi:MAG TPA: protoheme IX farnesyltransferase [Anaerolineae bacterium]|nr:protoheme IX farnesyltransferase [Anaerolineae bacterium]
MSAPVAPPLTEPVLASGSKLRVTEKIGVLVTLFKLRVVVLLLFAAFGGLILASGGMPGFWPALLLLITGGMSAAGASAINQYLERERDGLMERTGRRPLPLGQIAQPHRALVAGLGLVVLATLIALPFNPTLALFVSLGAAIYVGVYTLWLKPRTLTNIVIGGTAGSCAVLSGGAAAGHAPWQGVADPGVLLLALLVFVWTPTHFWSLALAYRGDYRRAGVPMLPVQTTPRQAAWWILLHTALTGLIALALVSRPTLGPVYLVTAGAASVWLWLRSLQLVHRPDRKRALAVFVASNAYLGLILLVASLETLARFYLR